MDDDAYPPVVTFDQTTTETMLEVTPELEPGSFSWTVQGMDADGITLAELNSQFLVKAVVEAIAPVDFAATSATPTLIWKPYPDTVQYQVILLDEDAFPTVVIADEETTATTFVVPTPLEAGSYTWTSWAKDVNGVTVAEANNQFVVTP